MHHETVFDEMIQNKTDAMWLSLKYVKETDEKMKIIKIFPHPA